MNQGSNFLGGTFSNRGGAPVQFRRDSQHQDLNDKWKND